MRMLRDRRRQQGLRKLRLIVQDARSPEVRARIAEEVARLDPAAEREALDWIEEVLEFDADETR
jgi:hypothetical protein